jgi:hypothetical protein
MSQRRQPQPLPVGNPQQRLHSRTSAEGSDLQARRQGLGPLSHDVELLLAVPVDGHELR